MSNADHIDVNVVVVVSDSSHASADASQRARCCDTAGLTKGVSPQMHAGRTIHCVDEGEAFSSVIQGSPSLRGDHTHTGRQAVTLTNRQLVVQHMISPSSDLMLALLVLLPCEGCQACWRPGPTRGYSDVSANMS